MKLFEIVNVAVSGKKFVSYVYLLEYVLNKLGRSDMLPYLNKIICPKRRNEYKLRLDKVFSQVGDLPRDPILARNESEQELGVRRNRVGEHVHKRRNGSCPMKVPQPFELEPRPIVNWIHEACTAFSLGHPIFGRDANLTQLF